MTKKEALELENKCDALVSQCLRTNCVVSLSLTSRFKISFENNYIILEKDNTVSYIKFQGEYSELEKYIDSLIRCMEENKTVFDKLIWSYEHISEIKNEELNYE